MIKTKRELLAAMKADPAARLYGHMGARPASPWKYRLDRADGTEIDTVSSVAVNGLHASDSLATVRGSWQHGVYRLTAAARA